MEISEELQEKIESLFKNNKELRDKLLAGDPDAISYIGEAGQTRFDPADIVASWESDTIEYLYKKAKKMIEVRELYEALCTAYYKERLNSKNTKNMDR